MIYAIGVKFVNGPNSWSKTYIYKSEKVYRKGDVVVVPARNWYMVGEVVGCKDSYIFKEDKDYKFVIGTLPEISYNSEDLFMSKLEKSMENVFVKHIKHGFLRVRSIDQDGGDIIINVEDLR